MGYNTMVKNSYLEKSSRSHVVNMPIHQAVKMLEDMGLAVEVDSF